MPDTQTRFRAAFRDATSSDARPDGVEPFPWQQELALAPEPPRLVDAPTGTGKTEAAVMGWLWRRRLSGDRELARRTQRRLILVLPMRVLVEQTHARVESLIAALTRAGHLGDGPVHVHALLGGAAPRDWTLDVAADQVVIATVDLAISASLNRGFARGRSSWPIEFGLLAEDTLIVYDEVQLLDAAVATSVQLDVFRREMRGGAPGPPSAAIWMSATLRPSWLQTVDHPAPAEQPLGITDADLVAGLGARLRAGKTLRRGSLAVTDADGLAERAFELHAEHRPAAQAAAPPWLTIVLCNTVRRAQAVHASLARRSLEAELMLLHSRFRPPDRRAHTEALYAPIQRGGRILVTTQVIEAGVDLDAAAMITDLCPWASFVQRAGRLNRIGLREASTLVWLDPLGEAPAGELPDDRAAAPYDPAALAVARATLLAISEGDVSPAALKEISDEHGDALMGAPPTGLVLRRPDLVELFDIDPTLDGDDDDVRPYIRLGDDHDVHVAWRTDPTAADAPAPARDELCAVGLGDAKALVSRSPLRWSYADERWEPVSQQRLLPGDQLLLDTARGMYSPQRGWDPSLRAAVEPIDPGSISQPDADSRDALSAGLASWHTIADHTDDVIARLEDAIAALALADEEREALLLAARWHDAGKAHPVFQARLGAWTAPRADLWAKSAGPNPGGGINAGGNGDAAAVPEELRRRARGRFRHEAASVLMLHAAAPRLPDATLDLALYLAGAHHGKLRVLPRTAPAGDDDAIVGSVLGVRLGDELPDVELGAGERARALAVDEQTLDLFALGSQRKRVWIERVHDLLDAHGPFRLAYLEALLRVADQRASMEPGR